MAGVMKFYGFEFSSASHASPELSSAQSCFKGAITLANMVFLIFGAVLCGVGAYALQSKAGDLAGETLPQGIIAIGVFIILVSMLGCIAAYKEARVLLAIYFVFLLIFTIILLAVGIAVYAKKDQADEYLTEGWCAATSGIVQDVQSYYHCCGLYKFNDSTTHWDSNRQETVTAGCVHITDNFKEKYIPCPAGMSSTDGLACLSFMSSTFESSYVAAGASAIAFSVIMAVGMIVVCVLMSAIKEKRHLEDIRKLHRKLREAKEDPAHAGLRALQPLGGLDDDGYGEVDLNAQEPIDTDVSINMQNSSHGEAFDHAHAEAGPSASYAPSASTFAAAPPTKIKKKKKQPEPEPEPEVEETPYEEERYEGEGTVGYAPQADEYDESD